MDIWGKTNFELQRLNDRLDSLERRFAEYCLIIDAINEKLGEHEAEIQFLEDDSKFS